MDAKRDWGHAKDYVEAMWMMLQIETPEDYVVATGETRSVREFINVTFEELGIKIDFRGQGEKEVGIIKELKNKDLPLEIGQEIIAVDPWYYRPTEVELLQGDPAKAKEKLNWKPKYNFENLVKEMVEADLKEAKKSKYLKEGGY